MEPDRHTLIVAAHPDDETIGAGIWMARHKHRERITIVHITDGAPRGYDRREEYARARRLELAAALEIASIRPEQCRQLGHVDQEAYLHLSELVDEISGLIEELRPELVLTHPYEGGHPDHDAAAFAVAHATHGKYHEFTSYHCESSSPDAPPAAGRFLHPETPEQTIGFGSSERDLKKRMFDCFSTQREILKIFPLEYEKFRRAPAYDFTAPPHSGELQYEKWGIRRGEEWRQRAAEALQTLQTWKTAV